MGELLYDARTRIPLIRAAQYIKSARLPAPLLYPGPPDVNVGSRPQLQALLQRHSKDNLIGVYNSFTQVITHSQASGYTTAHSLDTNQMET